MRNTVDLLPCSGSKRPAGDLRGAGRPLTASTSPTQQPQSVIRHCAHGVMILNVCVFCSFILFSNIQFIPEEDHSLNYFSVPLPLRLPSIRAMVPKVGVPRHLRKIRILRNFLRFFYPVKSKF